MRLLAGRRARHAPQKRVAFIGMAAKQVPHIVSPDLT
jgi:hypothetical protein